MSAKKTGKIRRRQKKLSELPEDHPLRNLGYVIGGSGPKPSQPAHGSDDALEKRKERRISSAESIDTPDQQSSTPSNLDEPVSLEQKLIHEYVQSFGHPVPGYALRNYPNLVATLQHALNEGTPVEEFRTHVPNPDVTDEIHYDADGQAYLMTQGTGFLANLTGKQRGIIIVAALIFIGMAVYPPWVYTTDLPGMHSETSAGYTLITNAPQPLETAPAFGVQLDVSRLMVQWMIVVAATGLLLFLTMPKNFARRE